MSLLQALILGLVQGLGEFLPISSSGHLALAEHFLGLPNTEEMFAFDVLLHVGTLIALLVYFRQDIRDVVGAWARSLPVVLRPGGWRRLNDQPHAKWGWLVLLSMVPTGAIALGLHDFTEPLFANVAWTAVLLLVAGTLNWISDSVIQRRRTGRAIEDMSPRDALLCGTAQGLAALFHGISRSGSTICAGLLLGLDPAAAPRFSFLMAIPAVMAAAAVELPKLSGAGTVPVSAMVLGALVAAVSGYWAIHTVFRVVRAGRLRVFAYYCWAVGLLSLVLILMGVGGHIAG